MTKLEKTFTWNTCNDLVVKVITENAPIAVAGWDKPESELHMKLEFADSNIDIDPESICSGEYDEENNQLQISIDIPRIKGTNRVSMKLFVPQVTEVIAESHNGPMSVKNLHGIQQLTSKNGPISMLEIDGDLILKSDNGPINVKGSRGDIGLELKNGPLKIANCEGKIIINHKNGPVKVVNCRGELEIIGTNGSVKSLKSDFTQSRISSKNGQIYYEFSDSNQGDYDFTTDNGRINLIIPDEMAFDFEGRSSVGSFKVGISGDYNQDVEDGIKRLEMVRGSGTATIKAKTVMGSIILSDTHRVKTEYSPSFDIDSVIDDLMSYIPSDKLDKVSQQMEKVKEKIRNINLPDFEKKVESSLKKVEETIQNELNKESNKEAFVKVKANIKQATDKLHEKFKTQKHQEKADSTDRNKSRLKILQLLEDGKITAEEAEKLLKAVENNNE